MATSATPMIYTDLSKVPMQLLAHAASAAVRAYAHDVRPTPASSFRPKTGPERRIDSAVLDTYADAIACIVRSLAPTAIRSDLCVIAADLVGSDDDGWLPTANPAALNITPYDVQRVLAARYSETA